jgi:predicted transposase YbfD/YdcC
MHGERWSGYIRLSDPTKLLWWTTSPKGDLPLADWMVPVLYQQESYMPFVPTSNSTEDILDIDNFLEEPVSNLVGFPEQWRYGFIGRDYDILHLERAFRQNNVVLLQGMGGVEKTELTAGFARWLEETQGREKIFFTSFESGASLSRVVNEVGRAVWGDKFSQYAAEQQQRAVLKYLQSQPCLLIWDNFEPVAGFPEGNEPLLSADELNDLKRFLKELRGGKTWVLITSRREEAWLDCGYSLINLQGLSPVDAQEFAAKILQTLGVEIKNLPEEYLDLLKLLGGHPLSLRVVLPHLRSQTPAQVIEVLRQGLDSLEKKTEAERDKSLTASLDYSFSKLSEKARRHLPFLGLFCERVYAHTLSNFSKEFGFENLIGFGKTYQSIFGQNFEIEDWLEILNETVKAGILEDFGDDFFILHPALVETTGAEVIPIDGKTLKGSYDRALGKTALHLVTAWSSQHRLVLGQVKVADKSNEITAIPALLELLDISGCIITIDAMGTQTAIASQIFDAKADYILALKANHPTIHAQVKNWFEQHLIEGFEGITHSYDHRVEKGHHRTEKRQIWCVPVSELSPLHNQDDWAGLRCVVMVVRVRHLWNQTTREVQFYITSLDCDACKLGQAIRLHVLETAIIRTLRLRSHYNS